MTVRRAWVLIRALPYESPLWQAIRAEQDEATAALDVRKQKYEAAKARYATT